MPQRETVPQSKALREEEDGMEYLDKEVECASSALMNTEHSVLN